MVSKRLRRDEKRAAVVAKGLSIAQLSINATSGLSKFLLPVFEETSSSTMRSLLKVLSGLDFALPAINIASDITSVISASLTLRQRKDENASRGDLSKARAALGLNVVQLMMDTFTTAMIARRAYKRMEMLGTLHNLHIPQLDGNPNETMKALATTFLEHLKTPQTIEERNVIALEELTATSEDTLRKIRIIERKTERTWSQFFNNWKDDRIETLTHQTNEVLDELETLSLDRRSALFVEEQTPRSVGPTRFMSPSSGTELHGSPLPHVPEEEPLLRSPSPPTSQSRNVSFSLPEGETEETKLSSSEPLLSGGAAASSPGRPSLLARRQGRTLNVSTTLASDRAPPLTDTSSGSVRTQLSRNPNFETIANPLSMNTGDIGDMKRTVTNLGKMDKRFLPLNAMYGVTSGISSILYRILHVNS